MGAIKAGDVKVGDGNFAAAHAVRMAKPDLIAIYPITPQTSLIEKLSQFRVDGQIDSEMIEVEGETSAIGLTIGAAVAGGRVFTSTSSMGLNFMFDGYQMAAYYRQPIVMVNANRENPAPAQISAGEQDVMTVSEVGWIQIHVENCQEIFDSVLMAYKLAEDPEILMPVCICYDGFYLSYLREPIKFPAQETVDKFIPRQPRPVLGFDPPTFLSWRAIHDEDTAEYRLRQQIAYDKSKDKIDAIDEEFGKLFGRRYGGQIEKYRMEDAEIALVCLGSHTGTARVVIDKKREEGIKVGLVKVRSYRPFPKEKLPEALKGLKAIGVIDRSVCFTWQGGHIFRDLKTSLYGHDYIPLVNFIGGLAGHDITIPLIENAVDVTMNAAEGKSFNEVIWMALEDS